MGKKIESKFRHLKMAERLPSGSVGKDELLIEQQILSEMLEVEFSGKSAETFSIRPIERG